jgi:serine/threonine protein kinase/tetratricopeptide (TPR) repeat protein
MTDQDIIEAAVKISDETERSQYIERASQGDVTRRRRIEAEVVQAFVNQYAKTGEAPPVPSGATMTSAATPPTRPAAPSPFAGDAGGGVLTQGARIGPYKLLQKLGEGGMGSVWMAEQEKPVRRIVAVKAIKPGMDSDRVLARFEAERQALALMDHPNIAKVLDAGTTENGCPYFVMELVKGVPVTKYCDDQKLDIKARLELFIPICQAIQHAHQKGIIHRDLKPSNVMVALYDGRPIPKVIDFGIAKATGPKLTDKTIFTEFGTVIGTLEYMAPEQAELNALDIDTRSDIYSLGVMLYELLTGTTPLGRDTLQRAAFAEVIRRIKEEEPPRPSTRLSDSKDSLPGISAQRQMEPAKLPQAIRGDLDWIVMKALAKERDRRYSTCNNFAVDLMHFLQNEPVTARPPSTAYLLQKFARRHRAAVASAAVSVLLLIGATVFSTIMYGRAETERNIAEKERGVAVVARNDAVEAGTEAKEVREFFQETVLRAVRPPGAAGLGRDVTVRQAIEAAEPVVGKQFVEQPRVEAAVREVLGNSYQLLGEYDKAIGQLDRSLELRKKHLGPQHLETIRTENNLQAAKDKGGTVKGNIDKAKELFDRARAANGPDHRSTLAMQSNLAFALQEANQLDEAMAMFQEVRDRVSATFGANDPDVFAAINNMGLTAYLQGRTDVALERVETALAARKQNLGLMHPDTLLAMNNVATLLTHNKNYIESIRLFEDALWLGRELGPTHIVTQQTVRNFGQTIEIMDGMERAEAKKKAFPNSEAVLRRCLDYLTKKSPDDWLTFQTQSLLGWALTSEAKEKRAEAESLLIKGYEGLKKSAEKIPPGDRARLLTSAADRTADYYKARDKIDDEKKWREIAKSHQPKA